MFEHVYVVYGFVATRKQLLKWEKEGKLLLEKYEWENAYAPKGRELTILGGITPHDPSRKKARVFKFPCCSESGGEKFLVGYRLHTYYHTCDQLGMTNNGAYDVRAILNKPVKINMRHICLHCFHDNRRDLGGPTQTAPYDYEEHMFLNHTAPVKPRKKCRVCRYKPTKYRSPRDFMAFHNSQYARGLKGLKKKPHLRFWYMIDDCTSCT